MLSTIRQVNEEFFRKFYGLKVTIGGKEKTILCRYAKRSSYDYAEEQDNQMYPCIVIQDYTPTPKKEWFIDMHAYFGGKSLDGLDGYLYQRPIWMEFRYDVSVVSKSYNEFISLQDYFVENFVYGKRFLFNEQLSGEDAVGDVVPYTVRETSIPRTDGVFETNYEFTCSVWLYPRKAEEVSLIQNIILRGNNEKASASYVITKDNKVLYTEEGVVIGATSDTVPFSAEEVSEILRTAVTSEDGVKIKIATKDTERTDADTLYMVVEDD